MRNAILPPLDANLPRTAKDPVESLERYLKTLDKVMV